MKRSVREREETNAIGNFSNVDASVRYTRFSGEQVEVLEHAYSECPKPDHLRREQLVRDFPVLANVDIKQIKTWFQNRRRREKQEKEDTEHHSYSQNLSAINKILMEANERQQERVRLLVSGKGYLQQMLDSVTSTNGWNCAGVMIAPQHSLMASNDPSEYSARLIPIAKDTFKSFYAKLTATAANWVPMPWMKMGPNSSGYFSISQSCTEVAARAFGSTYFNATKVAEILKDRACWFQDCRSTKSCTTIYSNNGDTIELMYTQSYAATAMDNPRDFWTLRYSTTFQDGTLVVCERSLPGNEAGTYPDVDMSFEFVRTEILPSGYLILPRASGGSVIFIVDHINYEACAMSEILRPIYESSEVLAERRTIAALRYVTQLAQEEFIDESYEPGREPAILRNYSKKLSRGFNDAINGFIDDGWRQLGYNVNEDVIVAVKSTNTGTSSGYHQSLGGIICAKTQMLIENLAPQVLVNFLRHHRSEWADFGVDSYCAAFLKASSYPHPARRPTRFSGRHFMMPLGQTILNEQMLEVVRLESLSLGQEDELKPWDVHLLQMCSGINEIAAGAYAELIFSSIDDMLPDDCVLLPSGFRMIPLIEKSAVPQTISNEEGNATSYNSRNAILTMAFQFPIGDNQQDTVASMARQYVRKVMSSVVRLAAVITPSQLTPYYLSSSPGSPEAHNLAQWTWKSYCSQVGGQLLQGYRFSGGFSFLENLWVHQDTILCFSFEKLPRLLSINQAGLSMLETNLVDLKNITVDKIMSELAWITLRSEFPRMIREGFVYLPCGICTSRMGHRVSYKGAVAWKVRVEDQNETLYFAMSFENWSFF